MISVHANYFPGDPVSPYFPLSQNASMPSIPVVTMSHADASALLGQFSNTKGIPDSFKEGLEEIVELGVERNFTASVEVDGKMEGKRLFNVMGTIPGR